MYCISSSVQKEKTTEIRYNWDFFLFFFFNINYLLSITSLMRCQKSVKRVKSTFKYKSYKCTNFSICKHQHRLLLPRNCLNDGKTQPAIAFTSLQGFTPNSGLPLVEPASNSGLMNMCELHVFIQKRN